MAENTPKTRDELKKMAEEIRENVRRAINESRAGKTAQSASRNPPKIRFEADVHLTDDLSADLADGLAADLTKASISLEIDALSPAEHTVAEPKNADVRGDENFWDLGRPRERIYAPPKFSGKSLSVTDVRDDRDRDGAVEISSDSESADSGVKTVQAEKILPREAYNFRDNQRQSQTGSSARVRNTVDGPRAVPSGHQHSRVVTSSYRRKAPVREHQQNVKKPAETVKTYSPRGLLIREVSVRTWESDVEFYGRFATDARQSHAALPKTPYSFHLDAVPYFSYVPQYAHMNLAQVEFYRHLRENIRHGIYPDCDMAYLQLYIFEIINLPDIIPADEGAEILASIWLNYRARHPRLDGCLCEWLADYCLIGGCPLPEKIRSLLPEIVPKAQFKEFYLNTLSADCEDGGDDLGRTILEVSSDYDYRSSRYYRDHSADYDRHIPSAVTLAMTQAKNENRGIFAMDRVYKMTRDSYSGAIVSSGIKRRLDIEFLSFTRRADTRQAVTAIAKYTENKLRAVLGIKAKLGVDKISPEDTSVIDSYFAPLMPSTVKKPKEDRYMPEDYMKNYESEDSGFDFAAAQAIEAQSWMNTSRLTGDDTFSGENAFTENRRISDDEAQGENITLSGEMSSDMIAESADARNLYESTEADAEIMLFAPPEDSAGEENIPADTENTNTPEASVPADNGICDALRAALLGEFRLYCRRNNLYEGEVADRVNNIFLDELGDVVLENSGSGFELVEDYREDVENWLS